MISAKLSVILLVALTSLGLATFSPAAIAVNGQAIELAAKPKPTPPKSNPKSEPNKSKFIPPQQGIPRGLSGPRSNIFSQSEFLVAAAKPAYEPEPNGNPKSDGTGNR